MTTATEALTGYFRRLTEVKEQQLALKQRQYEEKMAMKREEHEIYKKMEVETLYYQSKTPTVAPVIIQSQSLVHPRR